MRKDITVVAESRDSRGKNEARRLRVKGVVPAVLYGGETGPLPVAVNPKELTRILNSKTGHNTIFNLSVTDKENTPVMIVDWQHDPIKESLLHVDLKRIDLSERITVKVPVITQGDPRGVKLQGGIHEIITREVEIECLPDDIPEQFLINVTELMIGQSVRAADIPLTGSMKLLSPGDAVISHVVSLRAETEAVVEGAATGTPEPEVAAKKGKKEEEAAAPAKAAAPAAKKK
jgi:large subunit ribosomal protein L25